MSLVLRPPAEGMEAMHTPHPTLCLPLGIFSIWLFLCCILYNKPLNVSEEFPWVLLAVLANFQN